MENLNENEVKAQATVGVNGQEERKSLGFIINLSVIIPDIFRYKSIHDKVNQIVEIVQKIEPSYTDKEITQALQNIYEESYNEISFEDFIVCLAIQNLNRYYVQTFIYDHPDIYLKINFKYFTKSHCQKIIKIFAKFDALKKLGKIKDEKGCIQRLMNKAFYAAQDRLGYITIEENEPRVKNLLYQLYVDDGIDKEEAERMADEIVTFSKRSKYVENSYVNHEFVKKEQSIHALSQIKIKTYTLYKIGNLDNIKYSILNDIKIEDENEKGKITIEKMYIIRVQKTYEYSFDFEIEE